MKPILFNSEMVRAILDGRKTQTRRAVKWPLKGGSPKPIVRITKGISHGAYIAFDGNGSNTIFCPYGKVGDRLWVRENTRTICYNRGNEFDYGQFCIEYVADKELVSCPEEHHEWWRHNWHIRPATTLPSIFMPRWASRITLEITAIRVERVQDITHGDMRREGIEGDPASTGVTDCHYEKGFKTLWDSINKKRGYGWDKNPWVWVVEFKVIK